MTPHEFIDNLLYTVWKYLSIKDILSLCMSNKYLYEILNYNTWIYLVQRDFKIIHNEKDAKNKYCSLYIVNKLIYYGIEKKNIWEDANKQYIFFKRYISKMKYDQGTFDIEICISDIKNNDIFNYVDNNYYDWIIVNKYEDNDEYGMNIIYDKKSNVILNKICNFDTQDYIIIKNIHNPDDVIFDILKIYDVPFYVPDVDSHYYEKNIIYDDNIGIYVDKVLYYLLHENKSSIYLAQYVIDDLIGNINLIFTNPSIYHEI